VTYSLVVRHPRMAKAARPGQFVIVLSHEAGERIPLTIADFDRSGGTITRSFKRSARRSRRCRLGPGLLHSSEPKTAAISVRLGFGWSVGPGSTLGFGAFEGALPRYPSNEFPNWYGECGHYMPLVIVENAVSNSCGPGACRNSSNAPNPG